MNNNVDEVKNELIKEENKEKRFYWIKLKTDFFNKAEIDFLLQQDNGCEYIVLYQMLCLNTANNQGEMSSRVGEMLIKYDPKKIARDTKYFDVDTVIVALELYKKLGLIYEGNNKILTISNFDDMVGSESKWAEKKRKYREQQDALRLVHQEDIVRQEIEIRDRDKSIDIDINNSVSVSVSEETLNALDEILNRHQIEDESTIDVLVNYLKLGMNLDVIENALIIPYNRNVMNFDFEIEEAPIDNPKAYSLAILENWNNFGVRTIEEAKKYNKLLKSKNI